MKQSAFHEFVLHDLMGPIGGVTSRAMFGGWSFYRDGIIFAIVAEGALYFKVGAANRAAFEAADSHPFTYVGKDGRRVAMSYWLVPDEVMEDGEVFREWVEGSLGVGRGKKVRLKKKRAP